MERKLFDNNKIKTLLNSIFLGFIISLAQYFVLLTFGSNEKITPIFFIVFASVFFLISDFILFPQKKIINNLFNFLIYSFLIPVTYIPVSFLYALYTESTQIVLFSEISTTFCVLSNYLLTKYISNQIFKTQEYVIKQEKTVIGVDNEVNLLKFNIANKLSIKKAGNLFVNNGDLANIIEKNALLQHLESKNTFNIISTAQKNQFETVIKNLIHDNYNYINILDNSGNLLYAAANQSICSPKSIFWISLLQYITKLLNISSQEDIKSVRFNIFEYSYEISKYGNYLILKGKKQLLVSQNKKSTNKKIDNIIVELFKNVSYQTLQRIEVETLNDLVLLT